MAAKKKAKSKKAKSRGKSKKPVAKKAKKLKAKKVKKKVAKKSVARKPAAKAAKATPMTARPAALPGEERVGIVTHYFNHLSVAIIQLETGTLRTGDTIHVKGHTSDFRQMVGSMEVDHIHVDQVQAGISFGLRVVDHAREHDVVYKVTNP